MADKMEGAEMEATQGTYEAEVALREQQLRVKQTQEMEALLHRGARGRDELQHTRKLDMERRQQRFKNVMVSPQRAAQLAAAGERTARALPRAAVRRGQAAHRSEIRQEEVRAVDPSREESRAVDPWRSCSVSRGEDGVERSNEQHALCGST
eukprot:1195707-Prorocentrum_minimum.AAC.1